MNSPLRILSVLLYARFPPDIRVEKVCGGWLEQGHSVFVLAQSPSAPLGHWTGRLYDTESRPAMLKSLERIANIPFSRWKPTFRLGWSYQAQIEAIIAKERIQVIHWNDLAMAHIGLAIARKHGLRFVVDYHENFPYNMWSTGRDLGKRSRRYSLTAWFAYEEQISKGADLIITSVDEMSQRLNGMHGISTDKMIEFLNAEDPDQWDGSASPVRGVPDDGSDVVIYAGSCSAHRGLDVIVRAVDKVKHLWPTLRFVIVGEGPSLPGLKGMVRDLHLEGRISFLGQRPSGELAGLMKKAVIGVVPHYKYGQTDNTIPHKLFQYMCCRLPVLVSSCAGLRRIVEETQSGLVFRAGDVSSAAECLLRLKDPVLRDTLGRNGRRACEGPYHLKKQRDRLAAGFERFTHGV